jgi:2',3'-cyclic-nucleotide 2'-phosphodiesterase (5'-nucleotidase family)
LDTGDALIGGGKLGDQTKGAAVVAGMSLMGYDAMALGPKELSLGPELLQQRIAEAEFPMLSANTVLSGSDELVAEPYTILEIGGHRVGVLGLTRMPGEALAGFDVLDLQQTAARYMPELAEQVDIVVILTNMVYRDGLALASAVPGADLLVAALPGQLPMQAVRTQGTGTLVVTAEQPMPRHTGRQIGRLLVTMESDGTLSGENWSFRPMDKQLVDDPKMTELLKTYLQQP